jgi:ureidoglycolate lyase
LRARPLVPEGFAPYGEVFAAAGGATRLVNDGRALRHDGLVRLEHGTDTRLPTLAAYRVEASAPPFAAEVFERHPDSSQVFLPLDVSRYLVAVAPATPEGWPDLDRAEAFVAGCGVGVHYWAGVWHVPLVALDRAGAFAMLMWETGAADTVEHRLTLPLLIHA